MKYLVSILILAAATASGFAPLAAGASDGCVAAASFHTPSGETTVDSCGSVTVSGENLYYGDLEALGITPVAPIVEIVPADDGYALIGSDGGVFAFGSFEFAGSVPGLGVYDATIVTAASTSDGYVLVDDSGAVYSFSFCPTDFRRGEWMTTGSDAGLVDLSKNPARSVPIPDLAFDMACYGWGDLGSGAVNSAIQTTMCESKGNMAADNGADFTMWQINRTAHASTIAEAGGVQALKADPRLATSFARNIYNYMDSAIGNGWQPWTCSRKMGAVLGSRVEIG